MHQLVHEHVVAYLLGHLHQAKVQRDVAAARARSPARPLIANADAVDMEPVSRGQGMHTRDKLVARNIAQIVLHERSQGRTAVEPDAAIGVTHNAGPLIHRQRHEPPTKHDRGAVRPLGWRMLNVDTAKLAFDPPAVFPYERLGFAARAASRDGHAERAVGLNAKDIASRAADPDEGDLRNTERLRCRLSLKLWNRPRFWNGKREI